MLQFPHILACACLFLHAAQAHTFMHVFMSPAERSAAAALMWQQAMGTKDKQADESGWSV